MTICEDEKTLGDVTVAWRVSQACLSSQSSYEQADNGMRFLSITLVSLCEDGAIGYISSASLGAYKQNRWGDNGKEYSGPEKNGRNMLERLVPERDG